MSFTIGSLFDGSGGFPLAAFMCGGVPVWASEIEPYPIAVTKSRFPYMKHLGDISKINGAEIEPVDVLSFGSPCQDISVAGLRKGIKHEDNGDDETTRSGLFMEAVRIIKEMREKTNGAYPNFAIWENVNGAFSSNKGQDFRIVLEELIKIVEPTAVMPKVPKNGWAYADSYSGDGWSLAYRIFDAQGWGVPQRRRRVYLVLDLRGQRARKILFEREGLRGYFETGRTPWQGASADAKRSFGTNDSEGNSVVFDDCLPFDTTQVTCPNNYSNPQWGDACHPLAAGAHPPSVVCKCFDARGNGDGDTANTITGDHNNRVTDYTSVVVLEGNGQRPSHNGDGYAVSDASYTLNSTEKHGVAYAVVLDRAFYNQGQNALYDPQYYEDGIVPPIVAKGPSAVAYGFDQGATRDVGVLFEKEVSKTLANGTCPGHHNGVVIREEEPIIKYIVRRLTPTECARLQGFPDEWGHPDKKTDFTDEEYHFWLGVRNTHAEINGKAVKDYNKKQMLNWYSKLHNDSSEYKMWGNGIALPNALYVMQGIGEVI